MQSTDWNSTLLQAAAYQNQTAFLELEFRGGAVYRYFGVPAPTYEGLLRAESKGRYFNAHIRNRFVHTKIHPNRRASNHTGTTEP